MPRHSVLLLLCLFAIVAGAAFGQTAANLRSKAISITSDTVIIDTLSLVPNGIFFTNSKGDFIDTALYKIDFAKARLVWKKRPTDSIKATYRVMPVTLDKTFKHKDAQKLVNVGAQKAYYNPFRSEGGNKNAELFKFDGLSKSGSISRGISFGNRQDVIVNSNLNLQLSGKLNDDVEVLASITDENIPFQPDGNTQQLQEFDKVFIQFSRKNDKLIIGDYDLLRPNSYFMNYNKRAQGLNLFTGFKLTEKRNSPMLKVNVGGAISKGRFARNVIQGQEGNQGPYKLTGSANESFIVVISGTEKVFIDGRLLTRGQQADYVIDYNTAEITFTSRQFITKDKRIVAEFQYSDKNYSRSLVNMSTEYSSDKLNLRFNAYSEQDSKNEPLLQTLNDKQKLIMKDAGDSLHQAITPSIDSIAFSADQVLYRKVDTLVLGNTYTAYVYSTDSTKARYRLGFSNVGQNKGNYRFINTSANGRVYQWVAPVGGIPQGDYEPVSLLITPKQQQMFTLASDYKISKNTKVTTEMALSNYNQNLFSDKDKKDDQGYALRTQIENLRKIGGSDSTPWTLRSMVNYEGVQKYFKPIERYRSVEFERDWNLTNTKYLGNEHLVAAQLELGNKTIGSFNYQLKSFNKGTDYAGNMNVFNANNKFGKYKLLSANSILNAKAVSSHSQYLRHKMDVNRTLGRTLILGAKEEQEINSIYNLPIDTLSRSSFRFYEVGGYLSTQDTLRYKFRLEYMQRKDFFARKTYFTASTLAKNFILTTGINPNPNHQFTSTTTYRILDILDTTTTIRKPEKSLANRIEYNATLAEGFINSNTFYEATAGQELKRDYTFLEVARGKGTHIWIDYNHNGIHERNEYEVAVYADTARYLKVYTPTNDYVKTRGTDFNEVLTLTPAALINGDALWQKVLARLSNQLSLQLTKKAYKSAGLSELQYLNPFFINVNDSALISTQSIYRNTFYINRSRGRFGMDLNWQLQQNKVILTNGFETRTNTEYGATQRWDITRMFTQNLMYRQGVKKNTSQYFSTRDYSITFNEIEPKLNYQPSPSFRLSIYYRYTRKYNNILVAPNAVNERTLTNKYGFEGRINSLKAGSIIVKTSVVKVDYNAPDNTPLAYEMLDGLKNGENVTWGLSLQRTLSNNTQLSVNYDGRKSPGINTVHTGGVQLRAFF